MFFVGEEMVRTASDGSTAKLWALATGVCSVYCMGSLSCWRASKLGERIIVHSLLEQPESLLKLGQKKNWLGRFE